MFHQLYYHIVWTTRERRPTITRDVAEFLDRALRSIASQERALVLELGMVTTHVHLLIRAHPMTSIPRLLQRLKGASSALAARKLGLSPEHQLRWAQGYTIQTISRSMLDGVGEYVRHQPERHPHEVIAGWVPTAAQPVRQESRRWRTRRDAWRSRGDSCPGHADRPSAALRNPRRLTYLPESPIRRLDLPNS
ncbi:MAG: IS200/IS605 family transposase [Gemmatimonadota bacterium]